MQAVELGEQRVGVQRHVVEVLGQHGVQVRHLRAGGGRCGGRSAAWVTSWAGMAAGQGKAGWGDGWPTLVTGQDTAVCNGWHTPNIAHTYSTASTRHF